ncbi:MAG TPA: hypothetical protein VJ944_02135 [Thermoplasmataceae archaeon]|nr:hypothetical protein [Thermoplasmataceae archaeon]
MLDAISSEVLEEALRHGLMKRQVGDLADAFLEEFGRFPASFGELIEVLG